MVKRRFSKHLVRAVVLIMLGVVLFTVAPANRAVIVAIPLPAASPTPVRTPEVKRPNPVRRFFSSMFHGIADVFRRPEPEGPGCNLPPIVMLTASDSLIILCRRGQVSPSQSCSPKSEVTLSASAVGTDNELLFTWMVTGGRLRGDGGKVTWDLNGLPDGTYTASVEANAGNNLVAYDKTTVKVSHCTDCVWGESRCPTVSVSCPSGADSKKPVVFEASVAWGDWEVKPSYTWSLTAGKIMTGQGTTKITLNVSELAGKSVTATVIVGGFDTECTGTHASCTVLTIK